MARNQYTYPMTPAGMRNGGKTTLERSIRVIQSPQDKDPYATVNIAAKKVASELFTACSELAKEESMVSISFPKRLSIRPMEQQSGRSGF
jgi:hypothetical protein